MTHRLVLPLSVAITTSAPAPPWHSLPTNRRYNLSQSRSLSLNLRRPCARDGKRNTAPLYIEKRTLFRLFVLLQIDTV